MSDIWKIIATLSKNYLEILFTYLLPGDANKPQNCLLSYIWPDMLFHGHVGRVIGEINV